MAKQKGPKDRYNFLIDTSVYKEFSALCEELGFVRSKKVEHFMQAFIFEHRKKLDEQRRNAK